MDFFQLLNQAYPSLTQTEKRLADYIAEHSLEATRLNIRQLSAAANVSASTVVRLVHNLGFEKYSQMVISMACCASLLSAKDASSPERDEYSVSAYAAQLEAATSNAIHQTVQLLLENDDLTRAAKLLKDAEMTYLYGIGSSGVVAQELMQKMVILGKPCFFQSDSYLSAAGARNIGVKDVAVGISYSGRNQVVLSAIENAKKQGAATICITRSGSRLSRFADVCLRLPPVMGTNEKGENLSRYAQSIVLDMLYFKLR